MSNFYEAFEREKASDIRHYGKKGMKWGVITSEYQKVGNQPGQQDENSHASEYSEEEQRAIQASADAIRGADAESVKEKRKRILREIRKGVVAGTILVGLSFGPAAVKEYAQKKGKEFIDSVLSNPTSKKPFGGYVGSNVGNRNHRRTKAGMTSAGESLRRKVNGG